MCKSKGISPFRTCYIYSLFSFRFPFRIWNWRQWHRGTASRLGNFVQTVVVVDTLRSWERNRPRFGRLYLEEDNRRRRHRRRGDDSACKNRTRRPSIYGCVDNYYTSLRYYWHLTDGDAEVQRHHKIATIQEAGRRGCSWLGYDAAFFLFPAGTTCTHPRPFQKNILFLCPYL
jgi:hypothetical protein